MRGCADLLVRREGGALDHPGWLGSVRNLDQDDYGVKIHENMLRMLRHALVYDGHATSNSEVVMRKDQLTECIYMLKHGDRQDEGGKNEGEEADKSPGLTGILGELSLFSDTVRDQGEAMFAPAPLGHVARELERDASIHPKA